MKRGNVNYSIDYALSMMENNKNLSETTNKIKQAVIRANFKPPATQIEKAKAVLDRTLRAKSEVSEYNILNMSHDSSRLKAQLQSMNNQKASYENAVKMIR